MGEVTVRTARKIVNGCEPIEIGHGLQVPDDDGWFSCEC